VLLVFGAPCQLLWLVGPEHGRTIPLAVIQGRLLPRHNTQAGALAILVLTGQIAECPAVRGLGSMNIKRSNFDSTSIAIWRSSALLNALWRQRIK
jgi:hypothetical protein